ncbi:MAG: hypothetical protein HY899_10710 [Deltaproteobacteria bacterium]|nr:hypothetical protein [Deltaproteobacteria bacterium]
MSTSVVAADFADLSVLRLRLRNVPAQAWRLVEPHWTRVPEYQRGAVQAALLEMFDDKKLLPSASNRLAAAIAADPALAAQALTWLRSPLASEIKFVEATASRGDLDRRDSFLEKFAQISDDGGPEVRMSRIRALAEATDAVETTLDVTQAVGVAAAGLVNASIPSPGRLAQSALEAAVRRERAVPQVAKTYEPVVLAALLYRYRDLSLDELDEYVAFARSDAGRWYHRVVIDAVLAAVEVAGKDVGEADLLAKSGARPVFDPEEALMSLPSGRRVRVLGMTGVEVDAKPAVILRYETFLTLEDAVAVRKEAGEVWERVRGDIENAGSGAVVLQATGSVDGWVFPSASTRSFAWRREHDGAWKLMPAAPPGEGGALEGVRRETLWSVPP